ncbi:hypothetical protein V8G54_001810 [Vigna mungo]|uniref:Uncharacterized protein n=1 Tax=Vigna mungo TaxID=3915 RepID=A0AAQ3SBV1_VIGMU
MVVGTSCDDVADNGISWVTMVVVVGPRRQFVAACICQGDAFLALNKFDLAKQSYLTSLDIEPSIRHSKSFKVMFNVLLYARVTELQEKLAAGNKHSVRSGV